MRGSLALPLTSRAGVPPARRWSPAPSRQGVAALAASLEGFLRAAVAAPATVATDGWGGYAGLAAKGYGPPERLSRGARTERFAVTTASHLAQVVDSDGSGWRAWVDLGGTGLIDRPTGVS